jgi:hypothetical protein
VLTARLAGFQHAANATRPIKITTPPYVRTSAGPMRLSIPRKSRARAHPARQSRYETAWQPSQFLAEHRPQHIGFPRAERHPDGGLPRAPRDGVRHHAVQPARGQQEREARERSEQHQ